jgi:hypothetical protein
MFLLAILAELATGFIFRGIIMALFKMVTNISLPILSYHMGIAVVLFHYVVGFGALENLSLALISGLVLPELIKIPVSEWFTKFKNSRPETINDKNAEELNKTLKTMLSK